MTDQEDNTSLVGLPHEHPHWAMLGRVISTWAFYERLIDQLIWNLAGLDPHTGGCITAQLISPRPRLHAALALCRHRGLSEPLTKKLNTFKEKTEPVYAKRNRIVHDPWFVGVQSRKAGRHEITAQSRLILGFRPVEENELLGTLSEIDELAGEFQKTVEVIAKELKLDFP